MFNNEEDEDGPFSNYINVPSQLHSTLSVTNHMHSLSRSDLSQLTVDARQHDYFNPLTAKALSNSNLTLLDRPQPDSNKCVHSAANLLDLKATTSTYYDPFEISTIPAPAAKSQPTPPPQPQPPPRPPVPAFTNNNINSHKPPPAVAVVPAPAEILVSFDSSSSVTSSSGANAHFNFDDDFSTFLPSQIETVVTSQPPPPPPQQPIFDLLDDEFNAAFKKQSIQVSLINFY